MSVDHAAVLAAVRAGGTGASIGLVLGVSRERVRQIWKAETGMRLPTVALRRAARATRLAEPRHCKVCGGPIPRPYYGHSSSPRHLETVFWSYVKPDGDCLIWQGPIYPLPYNVYGRFSEIGSTSRGPRSGYAHRYAYETTKGPIPAGFTIDHLCRRTLCVNALHLEAVPSRVNILRGEGAGAKNARKTHCLHGHPFDEANTRVTVVDDRQHRTCRACRRSAERLAYQRRRYHSRKDHLRKAAS